MPLTTKQAKHIKEKYGEDRFADAITAASWVAREDGRLVGLDKIREAIIFYSALKASGCDVGEFSLGRAMELTADMHEICLEVVGKALKAIKKKSKK